MFNNAGGYSLADVAAATGNNRYGYNNDGFGSQWWIIVIFLFAFMNNGWGNRNAYGDAMASGALTRGELCQDMNFQELMNAVRGNQSGICDGFYAQLANHAAMQRQLCDEFRATNDNIQQVRFDQKDSSNQIQRSIDALGFQGAQDTCRLENLIRQEIKGVTDLITSNTIQDLRDKVADKDRDLMVALGQLSQVNQNTTLINTLRPCPIPAYPACPPNSCCDTNFFNNGCCNG